MPRGFIKETKKMDIQKMLLERIKEIINAESKKETDKKKHICWHEIYVDCNGQFVASIGYQRYDEDGLPFHFIKEIIL